VALCVCLSICFLFYCVCVCVKGASRPGHTRKKPRDLSLWDTWRGGGGGVYL
jgi:hypothetical protein